MPEIDEIFDDAVEIPRDRYDRPLLVPSPERAANPLVNLARGDEKRHPGKLPYTRASSLANYVSDHTALSTWKQRSLTKGLGEREDLAAMAAALPPIIGNKRDKAGMSKAEKMADQLTNRRLDEIAEEAMIYANRDHKANWGTAIHSFTDPGDHGDVPARMAADVASWFTATAGWVEHANEVFVRNDDFQCAGSFDHLMSIPWLPELGRLVVDKKTGLLHPDQFSVQLSVYATGTPYDWTTHKPFDWPDGIAPNQEWGILAHIPLGLGRTELYLVDLVKGTLAAHVACAVRSHRADKTLTEPFYPMAVGREHVASLVAVADSRLTMTAIATEWKVLWNDDLRALARQRLAEIEGP